MQTEERIIVDITMTLYSFCGPLKYIEKGDDKIRKIVRETENELRSKEYTWNEFVPFINQKMEEHLGQLWEMINKRYKNVILRRLKADFRSSTDKTQAGLDWLSHLVRGDDDVEITV